MEALKAAARKSIPGLFDSLLRIRRGKTMRVIGGAARRYALRRTIAAKKPFVIDLACKRGFGATLSELIVMLSEFDTVPGFRGVRASNPLYSDEGAEQNMLDLYLDSLIKRNDEPFVTLKVQNQYEVSRCPLGRDLTIETAHELFKRHYRIKQAFIDEALAFHLESANNAIGVHFRGSDKRFEAAREAWSSIAEQVDHCLASTSATQLFVATDELEFLEFMRLRYGTRVTSLDCRYLSKGGIGAHFLGGDGFEKGREALLTILLLSMCKLCVRGASHLSAWAKILNPSLPIVMIGRPYDIEFPEREIIESLVHVPAEREPEGVPDGKR